MVSTGFVEEVGAKQGLDADYGWMKMRIGKGGEGSGLEGSWMGWQGTWGCPSEGRSVVLWRRSPSILWI